MSAYDWFQYKDELSKIFNQIAVLNVDVRQGNRDALFGSVLLVCRLALDIEIDPTLQTYVKFLKQLEMNVYSHWTKQEKDLFNARAYAISDDLSR